MAYTYQEIVNLADEQGLTGREIAARLGITQPTTSDIPEPRYLNIAGNRVTREARDEVEAGNGNGLYGEKRRSRNNSGSNDKKDTKMSGIWSIDDPEIVMAVRLAARKAGIDGDEAIRTALEFGNEKFTAFLDFALSANQIGLLRSAIGIRTPYEIAIDNAIAAWKIGSFQRAAECGIAAMLGFVA